MRLKIFKRAREIVQLVKRLGAKPDDLSWSPGPMWWDEQTSTSELFSDLHTCAVAHTLVCALVMVCTSVWGVCVCVCVCV